MFDCDDYLSSGSDRYQSGNGYHAVPPPYIGTFMPPKPNLVFNNAPNDVETDHSAFTVKLSPTRPDQDLSHTHKPSAPIIEDWVSDLEDESETKTPQNVPSFVQPTEQVKSSRLSVQHVETSIPSATSKTKMAQLNARNHAQKGNHKHYARMLLPDPQRHVVPVAILTQSKLVPINAVRPVSTAIPKLSVTRPRQAKTVITKTNSPPRRHIDRIPSPKASTFPPKVTDVKAPMVNAAQVVQGKWELKPKCLILDHVSRNTSASMTLKRFDYNDALGRSKLLIVGVIINRDSPVPIIVVDGVVQLVTHRSTEQKVARRNELKARGTLLMALFHGFTKLLIVGVIINRDSPVPIIVVDGVVQLVTHRSTEQKVARRNELKAREDEDRTILFDDRLLIVGVIINRDSPVPIIVVDGVVQPVTHRSTEQKVARRNELKARVSAATSVFAVCAKLPVSSHPNIDSLSNAVIFSFFSSQSTSPQLDNEDLKQIDVDDLKEMDLRWQMAMLTMRARRTAPVENSTSNALVSQCDGIRCYDWSYQAEEEPANFSLMAITSSSSSSDNKLSPSKPAQDLSHTTRPLAPIIEDWVSDSKDESEINDPQMLTQSKPVFITAVRPVCTAVPKIMVTRPRHAHSIDTKSKSPIRRKITRSPYSKTSNSPPRVTAAQALVVSAAKGKKGKWGNPQYALKDKEVIDSGCSWHMTGNMSYLFNFEKLNGGYVAFGGNPKGGKIYGKGKIKTGNN
nr:hypothetical protein [Tanacetum cinerariifolium]